MPDFCDLEGQGTAQNVGIQETSCENDHDIVMTRIGVHLRPPKMSRVTGAHGAYKGLYPKFASDDMRRKSFSIFNTHLEADFIQKLVQSGLFAIGMLITKVW